MSMVRRFDVFIENGKLVEREDSGGKYVLYDDVPDLVDEFINDIHSTIDEDSSLSLEDDPFFDPADSFDEG